jgi:hypothetical protein
MPSILLVTVAATADHEGREILAAVALILAILQLLAPHE